MHFKSLVGKLGALPAAKPRLWPPFIWGWSHRSEAAGLPCLLPRAQRLVFVPRKDYYGSYAFFAETKRGRAEVSTFLGCLQAGDVVYDIGGYLGAYTVAAACMLPQQARLHVFEPLPANVKSIRRICKLNELNEVTVVPMAVGSSEAVVGSINADDGMLRLGDSRAVQPAEFESITLDAYVGAGAPPPSVVKVDVEGYELQVLAGGRELLLKHRPLLWVEVHPEFLKAQGRSHEEVSYLLRELGYEIDHFRDRGFSSWEKSYHVLCRHPENRSS